MRRSELSYVVIGVLLGAIVGGLIGQIIGSFLPEGTVKTLFTESIRWGITDSVTIDLHAISLTFGIAFQFNFVSVLMMIFVLAYFRWWYL